jgi:hypothetical protein
VHQLIQRLGFAPLFEKHVMECYKYKDDISCYSIGPKHVSFKPMAVLNMARIDGTPPQFKMVVLIILCS